MNRLDEHGFMTREWAEANVPGFSELGSCCQQEVLLFPEIQVPCLAKLDPQYVPEVPVVPPLWEHHDYVYSPGTLVAYSDWGGGGSSTHGVAAPGSFWLVLFALFFVAFFRKEF